MGRRRFLGVEITVCGKVVFRVYVMVRLFLFFSLMDVKGEAGRCYRGGF